MMEIGNGVGVLTFTVWPTHAGACGPDFAEPTDHIDYRRGQITWEVGEDGQVKGRVVIDVPKGEWTHIIYAHTPGQGGFITAQQLSHPFVMTEAGTITLEQITEADVTPQYPVSGG